LLKGFLDGPLPKLCPVIPTSNQDGRQAKNRFEEISIFSNSSHLEWKAGLSDTIWKGTHPGTIPARFGLIWFSGFLPFKMAAVTKNRNFFKWLKLLYCKPECAQI
jgi:hypothetical protein